MRTVANPVRSNPLRGEGDAVGLLEGVPLVEAVFVRELVCEGVCDAVLEGDGVELRLIC